MTAFDRPEDALRVCVVGGSLGGLFAALALQQAGCKVDVYERSSRTLGDRGAGLRVQEDMVGRLRAAGIELEKSAISPHYFRFLGPGNEIVFEEATNITYTSWNRLYHLLLQALGPGHYHLGAQAQGLVQSKDGVRLEFTDRDAVECDLLVAADGLTSHIRHCLAPSQGPQYAGYVCWRGTVPKARLSPSTLRLLDDAGIYVMPAVGHISIYPIPSNTDVGPDACDYNVVWYRPVAHGDLAALMVDRTGHQRDWSIPAGAVKPADIAAMREAALQELPQAAAEVVTSITEPFIQVIVDVAVQSMVHGRVCLIADAAYGGRPHLGAGTAKAAADAWTLAGALSRHHGRVDMALREWSAIQSNLGRRYVEVNRHLGNDLVRGAISPQQFTSRSSWLKILKEFEMWPVAAAAGFR